MMPAPFLEVVGEAYGCLTWGEDFEDLTQSGFIPVTPLSTGCGGSTGDGGSSYSGDSNGALGKHAALRQRDGGGYGDQNLIGDVFEIDVYRLQATEDFGFDGGEWVDADGDGLPAYQEFRWGTIPLLDSDVAQIEDGDYSLEDLWSKDTDGDRLWDGGERAYWNLWDENVSGHYDEEREYISLDSSTTDSVQVFNGFVKKEAVRDKQSLLDPDGDASPVSGEKWRCGTPYNVSKQLGDQDGDGELDVELVGCSHVADDPDSDNDGLIDGLEVSTRDSGEGAQILGQFNDPLDGNGTVGVGRWVNQSEGAPGHDYQWQGGAFAEFGDSECEHSKGLGGDGNVTWCYNRGNYHNNTKNLSGHTLAQLNPGHGDGVPDKAEYDWYVELETTDETRYNWEQEEETTLWEYHKDHNSWDQISGPKTRGQWLHAFEIDYDGDGILPLMEHDADNDGLEDSEEGKYGCEGSLPYVKDTDYDGLSDKKECEGDTNPDEWDSDGDGLPDGYEAKYNIDDPTNDTDGDGLSNLEEYCYRTGTLTGGSEEQGKWGCDDDVSGEKYWDWNPCALDPRDKNTDDDLLEDGNDTNAANSNGEDGCPNGVSYEIKTFAEATARGITPPEENRDMDSYNSTLKEQVQSSTHDASEELGAEDLNLTELQTRAAERSQAILQGRVDSVLETIQRSRPVFPVNIPTSWAYQDSSLPEPMEIVTGSAIDVDSIGSRLVETTRQPESLTNIALLKEAEETRNRARGPVQKVVSDLAGGDLQRSLVQRTSAPLENPSTVTEDASLNKTLEDVNSTAENPHQLLESESVVPDFIHSLTKNLDSVTPEVSEWELYRELLRDSSTESKLDSSHYKVLALGPNGETNLTPNIGFGTEYHWNVDGDDQTGASGSLIPDCSLACGDQLTTGDDVRVEVTVKETPSGVLEPTFSVRNWAEEEDFPWLIHAFALPHTRNEDPLDPEGGDRGYVAHMGIDARPRTNDPVADASGFDTDRSYQIDDMPAWFNVSIQDFGLLTSPPAGCEVRDPASYGTFWMGFEPDNDTFEGRFDALPVAGVTEYHQTSDGKEIVEDGNSTRFSAILRGVPHDLRVTYSSNTTAPDCEEPLKNITDLVNWEDSLQIETSVERDWPGTGKDNGTEFAIRREANYSDTRRVRASNLVSSTLQSGSYHKTVTEKPLEDDSAQTHTLDGYPDAEIYVSQKRWKDITEDTTPDGVTRAWLSNAPQELTAHYSGFTNEFTLAGSEPTDTIRILNGATNGNCRTYDAEAANYVVLHGESLDSLSCYAARIHATEELAASWDSTSSGLEVNLTMDRVERNATNDGAEISVGGGDTWLRGSISDLPRTGAISIDHDQLDDGTSTQPGNLTLQHEFEPETVSPNLTLRSKPPGISGSDETLVKVEADDLPHHGEADLRFQEGRFNVSFPQRLSNLEVLYTETGNAPTIQGAHAAFLSRDNGKVLASASVPGFQSIELNATNETGLRVQGNVESDETTTLAINASLASKTGQEFVQPNKFEANLSSLPGAFDLRATRVDGSAFRLKGDMEAAIDTIDFDGVLRDRHYNVTVENAQDFLLSSERWMTDSGRGFAFHGENSQPLNASGRIVDVGKNDSAEDSYPAAPPWADDYLVRVEDPDGSRSLAFDITGVIGADITYESSDGNRSVDASYSYGSAEEEHRSFHLRDENKTEDQGSKLTYVNVSRLPSFASLTFDTGSLDYEAAATVPHLEAEVRNPVENVNITASVRDLPDDIRASWPPEISDSPTATILNHGEHRIGELYLRYADQGSNDPGPYFMANLSDIPHKLQISADPSAPQFNLTARDDSLSYTNVGLVDIRYNHTGYPPMVPEGCPEHACEGSDLALGDMKDGTVESAVARVQDLRWFEANLEGVDSGGSHLRYRKTAPSPAFIDIDTTDHTAVGHIASLPKTGELSLALDTNETGILESGNLGWEGSSRIDAGRLFFDLDQGTPDSRRFLFTEFRDVPDFEVDYRNNLLNATSREGVGYLDVQYASLAASQSNSSERASVDPAQDLLSQLPVFGDDPASNTSHYLYLDNVTKPGEEWELFQVRSWNLTNAYADPTNGSASLDLTSGTPQHSAEVRIDRPKLNGTLNVTELPRHLQFTWWPEAIGEEDRYERYQYRASDEVGTAKARINATVDHADRTDRFLVDVTATNLTTDLTIDRKGQWFRASTDGSGQVDEIEGYVQNITGPRAGTQPLEIDGPKTHGLVLVDEYNGNGSDLEAPDDLQQAYFHATGLRNVRAEVQNGAATATYNASGSGGSDAGFVLARGEDYTQAYTEAYPEGFDDLEVEMPSLSTDGGDGTVRNRSGAVSFRGVGTGLGDGYVYHSTPTTDGTDYRRMNVTYGDLPHRLAVSYNLVNRTDDGTVTGYERVAYDGSAEGADVAVHANDSDTRIRATLDDLPESTVLNVTRDRSSGSLTTEGTGSIGRIEGLIRPDHLTEYRELGEDVEGLLARNTSAVLDGVASNDSSRPANLTHVRVTDLEQLEWDVAENGLPGGESSFSLDHDSPDKKDVTLATATHNASTGNTTVTEADITDLPTAWNLSVAVTEGAVFLDYNASEPIPEVRVFWTRQDPSTDQGSPYFEASVTDVGSGETDLEADLNFTDGWNATFAADHPPDNLTASAIVGDHYIAGSWRGIPGDIQADVAADLRTGEVRTADGSGDLGTIDVFRARCEETNENGVCKDEPNRHTIESFNDEYGFFGEPYHSVLFHTVREQADPDVPPDSSFLHIVDVGQAKWSLGAEETPDWNAVRLERQTDLATNWGVLLRGYPEDRWANLTANLRDIPQNLEVMIHNPNATYGATAGEVPDGFGLEGADVDAGDWFLDLDVSDDTGFQPSIRYDNATQLLDVRNVAGLDGGTLRVDNVDEDFREGLHVNTSLSPSQVDVTVQQTPGSGATPRYLDAHLEDVPSKTSLHWVRNPSPGCPMGPGCSGLYGVDTHGGTIGAVDLVYKENASEPGEMTNAESSVGGENFLQVMSDQPNAEVDPETGETEEDPNAMLAQANLTDVKTVLAETDVFDAHVEATLPDNSASDSLDFHFTRRDDDNRSQLESFNASVRDLEGTLQFDWSRMHAGTTDGWEVSADLEDGTQDGPFSLNVSGNIEFERAKRNVTDYQVKAIQVSDDVSLNLSGVEGGDKRIRVETGDTGKITGRFNLESKENSSDDDDGGLDSPLHVYVNSDPSDNSGDPHTGGSVDLVDLTMTTDYGIRPNTTNHIGITKSTGEGVGETGKSIRLEGLERLEMHVNPKEAGTSFDLETEFESVDHEREFLLRQRNDSETTKVWSYTWPDETDIDAFAPSEPDNTREKLSALNDLSFSAYGVGGEMPVKFEVAPETGDEFFQPAWTIHGQAPVGDTHFDWTADIANGTTESMYIDVLGSRTMSIIAEKLKDAGGFLVGKAKTLASSVTATAESFEDDFVSTLRLDRTEPQRCDFQDDLDGVEKWSNQSVVHGDCPGLVDLDHEGGDYEVHWTVGATNASGSLDSVSVQFKDDGERRGDTTYRSATVDTGGSIDYEDPFLQFREGNREYTVPDCMWKGNC